MNAADKACDIPWELIAAIGRVESDHGRYGGNTLGVDGVSRPGIYGIALNGKNKTQAINDTDAGQYDTDTVWDRAVGPMQFIPSTWSVVGVDADGDAKRNPQDIDDAALASAVYLCSGNDNLATEPGQHKSVFRYNHSEEYVDLVLSIMNAYTEGDYTSVPNNIGTTVSFTRVFDGTRPSTGGAKNNGSGSNHPGTGSATTTPPAEEPPRPVEEPTDEPAPPGGAVKQVQETLKHTTTTVTQLLTLPQAILKCTSLGYNALLTPSVWNACITKYTE